MRETQLPPAIHEFPDGLCVYSLHGDGLYLLAGRHEVDGRSSRYPPGVSGTTTMNAYVINAQDQALLIDTGLTIHRGGMIEALAQLIPESKPLSILHTRLGEYDSICNTASIVNSRRVDILYGNQRADEWIDYDAELGERRPSSVTLRGDSVISLSCGRSVDVGLATLRLLPTFWAYDGLTQTLFTSDMFTYIVGAQTDDRHPASLAYEITEQAVAQHLLKGRYWWLPHVDPRPLQDAVLSTFSRFSVNTIAPGYGGLIHGAVAVRRQVDLLVHTLGQIGGTALS